MALVRHCASERAPSPLPFSSLALVIAATTAGLHRLRDRVSRAPAHVMTSMYAGSHAAYSSGGPPAGQQANGFASPQQAYGAPQYGAPQQPYGAPPPHMQQTSPYAPPPPPPSAGKFGNEKHGFDDYEGERFAPAKPRFNDLPFLLLFLAQLGGYVALAVISLRALANTPASGNGLGEVGTAITLNRSTAYILALISAMGAVLSLLYLVSRTLRCFVHG